MNKVQLFENIIELSYFVLCSVLFVRLVIELSIRISKRNFIKNCQKTYGKKLGKEIGVKAFNQPPSRFTFIVEQCKMSNNKIIK